MLHLGTVDEDRVLGAAEVDIDAHVFSQVSQQVDALARHGVEAKALVQSCSFELDDSLHQIRIPDFQTLNLKRILTNIGVFSQRHLVLVGDNLH